VDAPLRSQSPVGFVWLFLGSSFLASATQLLVLLQGFGRDAREGAEMSLKSGAAG